MPGDASVLRYGKLAELMKVILVFPHSNGKRLFSTVGKVETEQRAHLLPSTVKALISIKLNLLSGSPCHEVGEKVIKISLLKEAKNCYYKEPQ